MSVIDLQTAKDFLNVIHGDDDSKIQLLLDGAEDEALQFLDRQSFSDICECDSSSEEVESEAQLPASIKVGVLFLLQANYQASPDDVPKIRKAAEIKLFPYRCRLGI